MNDDRRKRLKKVYDDLYALYFKLNNIQSEEGDYFDSIPGYHRESESACKIKDNVSNLKNAVDSLSYALERIDEVLVN